MPEPTEADFDALLAKMKANADAKHGPGYFEQTVERGKLMMAKRADELTPTERAFLRGDTTGQN